MEQPGNQNPPSAETSPADNYPPPPPYPPQPPYPLTFDVEYPDRQLNRLTSFFRFLWIIPIGIVAALIVSGGGGESYEWSWRASGGGGESWAWSWGAGGFLFLPLLLMILFRKKYPRWWFDWNLQLSRFLMRVAAYALLLRDEYPSTDEEQAVHLDFDYPDAQQLSRGLPIVKWLLALPHWIVLCFLWIGAIVCVVIAWFAILFTGRYPRSLFDYVVGVNRWTLRVEAYAILLITDRYPPFTLEN